MLNIVASYHRIQEISRILIVLQENLWFKLKKWAKNLILSLIYVRWAQIRAQILLQSLDIMVIYHHVQYQKKTNDSILKKCSDGQTNRQTHKSDFIGRCPTRVERSIKIKHPYIHKLKSLRKKLFKLTSITAKNLTLK